MQKKITVIYGLILLAILLFICIYGVYFLAGWIKELNPSVAGAVVTATLSLFGLLYVQWQSKSRDIAESHRKSKIEVYNILFDLIDKFQNNEIEYDENNELPNEIKLKFRQLTRGLILWASPEVIKAYLEFRTGSVSNQGNILFTVDTLYRAIRKDLSNSNSLLNKGDLIKLNLKDPNELE